MEDYLNEHFLGKYMIWNVSEHKYSDSLLRSCSIEFVYVGYPNPPLHGIFSILSSLAAWLDSDPANVAVLHCQHSQSRSHLIVSCFLKWQFPEFESVSAALAQVCKVTGTDPVTVLSPSNARYAGYFDRVLSGEKVFFIQCVGRLLRIEKVVMSPVPRIEEQGAAIRPFLQLHKHERVLYSSAAGGPVAEFTETDNFVSFTVEQGVQDDVLLRCRHIGSTGRSTVFRAMFNASFVEGNVLRMTKQELDYADEDRIPEDFFVDILITENREIEDFELKNYLKLVSKGGLSEPGKKEEDSDEDKHLDEYFKKLESS